MRTVNLLNRGRFSRTNCLGREEALSRSGPAALSQVFKWGGDENDSQLSDQSRWLLRGVPLISGAAISVHDAEPDNRKGA